MFKRKKKIKLKPCPFCGGEVNRHEGIVKGIVMFTCYNCGADVCFYGAEYEPKASEVWNRRAEPTERRTDETN